MNRPEQNGHADNEVDLQRSKARRRAPADAENVDRLPPHAPEAERGVLGCILLSAKDCLPACIERFKAGGEEFYDLRHRTVYQTALELYEDSVPIDLITLCERLSLWQKLLDVGGMKYVSELSDAVPSSANLEYYLGIVEEKFLLRRMVQTCTEAVSRIYDFEGDVPEFLDGVGRDVLRVSEARSTIGTPPIKELVRTVLGDIETASEGKGAVSGLATGFTDFDKLTGGLQNGDMIVIAARPSVGKTSLAMNIADTVAVAARIPVAVFSLEMTARQLVSRLVCSRARVNLRNIREGFLAERDYPRIASAASQISASPLYIDDGRGVSILQLRAKARRLFQQFGIKLVVVDYLQLLSAAGKRKQDNRQQEVSDISAGVKALAGELGLPVVALSQLNRNVERDKKRRPMMSDLRESGSLEQDADVVGLLYRPSQEDEPEEGYPEAVPINLLVAKNRNGATGEVNLTFLKSYTRFESAARVSDDDVPQQQEMNPY
jgi:replicative DNA helicase